VVKFTIRGKVYDITREDVINAVKGISPESPKKYYVEINGKSYPIKQVIALVTRLPRIAFTAMDAYRVLTKLGFEVREVGQYSSRQLRDRLESRLSCREAIKRAIQELGRGPVTAEELFNRVRGMGDWSDSTIWQHLMCLVVNLPPAYRHWPSIQERFLFLREDGRYEIYNPKKHGIYIEGTRME